MKWVYGVYGMGMFGILIAIAACPVHSGCIPTMAVRIPSTSVTTVAAHAGTRDSEVIPVLPKL